MMEHDGNPKDSARDYFIGTDEKNKTGSQDKGAKDNHAVSDEPFSGKQFFFL
jgi:hypothetical protein